MIEIRIPGWQNLRLDHLVLDYNGTMACDGALLPGVRTALQSLSGSFQVHILTADTFGKVGGEVEGLSCMLSVLPPEQQDVAKRDYITRLDASRVVCIGNGRNDRLMLAAAALGIAVVQEEGAATEALGAADVVCPSILSALNLLSSPLRLVATLRS